MTRRRKGAPETRICIVDGCEGLFYAKGMCRKCHSKDYCAKPERLAKYRAYMADKRQNDPDFRDADRARTIKYLAEWRQVPENQQVKKAYMSRYSRERRQDSFHGVKQLGYSRSSRCGFPKQLINELREFQDGKCAICSVEMVLEGLGVFRECADHTEPNGVKVPRGLLCNNCNMMLGRYELYQRDLLRIEPYERYINLTPVQRLESVRASLYSRRFM